MASAKACDAVYKVTLPTTAKLLRELQYDLFYVTDHATHFYALAGPGFVMGPTSDPASRNIIGVIKKVGPELGGKVIDIRKRCREIIKLIASKPAHPEGGLPGGVSMRITEDDRRWMKETADLSVQFCQFSLQLFRQVVG